MQGKVEIAGVNTAKLKVLKSSETMELLRRSKAGDRQAREELIEGNLRRGEVKAWTICFRLAALGSSRPLTISIFLSR